MEPTLFEPPARDSRLLAGLNPRQREAVEYDGRSLLIVAGAGSGKTKVLTHRIARLIETRQAWPSQILAITFTNKAAAEMRQRVEGLLGQAAEGMWIATFHSACVRILRREAENFGFTSAFTIYDSSDTRVLLKRIIKQHNADTFGWTPAAVGNKISKLKNELVDAESFPGIANLDDPKEAIFAAMFRDYAAELSRANAFDFDDLIAQTVFLFRGFPQVAARYRQRFRHILVDEYQDTNHAQYQLIRELTGSDDSGGNTPASLTVVGDSDQSIYAFRGADIRNIVEFERDYPGAHTILLEQNYRSTQNILTAANAVIANNFDRREKHLWSDMGDGEAIIGFAGHTAHDEAQFIADEVHRLHDQGVMYRDIAVFYRTNAQTRALEDMLIRAAVPYRILGGTRFYERAEIKDAVAYLTVIANERDDLALRRILNAPKRGIGAATEATLAKWATDHQLPLSAALARVSELGMGPKLTRAIQDLSDLLTEMRGRIETDPVDVLLQQVLERSGYLTAMKASRDPQDEVRVENLEELVSVTAEYDKNNPDGDLIGFLTEVSLVAAADELDDTSGTVSLMTLHTAKGLEFDTVFITGIEEELLPHRMSAVEPGGLSEERRLFYVGITRAKRGLYLSLSTTRTTYGSSSVQVPSRFLAEIPDGLVEWAQPPARLSGGFGRLDGAGSSDTFAKAPKVKREWPNAISATVRNNEGLELVAGDRVRHEDFGEGTVRAVTGSGTKTVAEVMFDSGAKKKLLIRIAPISKV